VVADGINGWSLEDYTWNEKTGVGTYTYERVEPATGKIEVEVKHFAQPYHPSHTGWYTLARR
jgi:hypothetical protein